jgi:molecular chaperone HtpG
MRFLRGVVDSDDLPLNVSREFLQKGGGAQLVRKQLVKHVFTMLEDLAAEGETTQTNEKGEETKVRRYDQFWRQYGRVVKEGVHGDSGNRERIAKLLRFESSHGAALTSLAEYVSRMPAAQPSIYYVGGDSRASAEGSPHIESLRKRGFEVLYFTDPIDEWIVDGVREFDGKKIVSAAKGALDVPDEPQEKEKREEKAGLVAGLVARLKSSLAEQVSDVRVSNRLTDSPACLVSEEKGFSPHVERLMRANRYDVPAQKRILEINPEHPVIARMQKLSEDAANEAKVADLCSLLYDQALVAEGGMPADPTKFAKQLTKLMEEVTR